MNTMPYSFSVQVLLPIAQRLKRFSKVDNQHNLVSCIKEGNSEDTGAV